MERTTKTSWFKHELSKGLFGSKETPKCGPSTVVYISIQIKIEKLKATYLTSFLRCSLKNISFFINQEFFKIFIKLRKKCS
jgi:hypothetical protein